MLSGEIFHSYISVYASVEEYHLQLTVPQEVKKTPHLLWNPNIHYHEVNTEYHQCISLLFNFH
jgi:hypothetical protein